MPLSAHGLKTANRNITNNNNIKNNNNNNNQSDKSGNKTTMKGELMPMRKKQKILPLTEARTNIMTVITTTSVAPIAATTILTPSKPLKRLLPDLNVSSVGVAAIKAIKTTATIPTATGGVGRSKGSPLPVAVARRNARERNRVKQVNNGFAALRERIPEEVAEAFEAQGNGRGSAKKLSKVETLRMAVEYIRSLEHVLELDSSTGNGLGLIATTSMDDSHLFNGSSYQPSDTSSVISTLTPPPSDNISSGSFDDVDLLPDITTLDGHQYIRIPGTNTYQLLSNAISDDASILYENDENMEPLFGVDGVPQHTALTIVHATSADSDYLGPLVDPITTIGYGNDMLHQEQQQQQQHTTINTPIHILTPASISPGAYSAQSSVVGLSPAALTNDGNSGIKEELRQRQQQQQQQQHFITAIARIGNGNNNDTSALYLNQLPDTHQQFGELITLKTEIKDELYHEPQTTEENMIEVMDWWHCQQQQDQQQSTIQLSET